METDAPRPQITRVWAQNFRSIESLDLELGDLTVIVGRNGAGKSNTVDVLRFLRDCVARGFEQALLDRGGKRTVQLAGGDAVKAGVGFVAPEWQCQYSVELPLEQEEDRSESLRARMPGDAEWTVLDTSEARDKGLLAVHGWEVQSDQPLLSELGRHGMLELLDAPEQMEGAELMVWLNRVAVPERASVILTGSSFYDFTPGLLRSPQRVINATPLDEQGANLVAVLRGVLGSPDGDTLRQSLRTLVDGAQDIEVQALGGHLVAEVIYGARGNGAAESARFDLGLESDGTIRLIAILTALYQSPPRTLTVIEEPERNIHPGALGVLADVIKEASTRGQVLITTHSPDLIDHFDADDIRVVERVDGATVVGRMDRTQREVVREKLFTTGELMRVQGLIRDEDE